MPKLEKKKQSESRMYLVHGVPVCTNSWNTMYSALAVLILQQSDKRRVPWPTKLLRLVLRRWKSIMALKSCYTTRVYMRAQQIWFACIMAKRLLLTSNKVIVRKGKNGSKIIICRLQCTPWPTTTSTAARSNKELSWSARLTYIIKNSKQKALILEPGSTKH